jgi:hypothetical protein
VDQRRHHRLAVLRRHPGGEGRGGERGAGG